MSGLRAPKTVIDMIELYVLWPTVCNHWTVELFGMVKAHRQAVDLFGYGKVTHSCVNSRFLYASTRSSDRSRLQ